MLKSAKLKVGRIKLTLVQMIAIVWSKSFKLLYDMLRVLRVEIWGIWRRLVHLLWSKIRVVIAGKFSRPLPLSMLLKARSSSRTPRVLAESVTCATVRILALRLTMR